MSPVSRLVGLILLAAPWARAFYLPGSAPHDYSSDEKVDVFVNALTPVIGPQAKLVRSMYGSPKALVDNVDFRLEIND